MSENSKLKVSSNSITVQEWLRRATHVLLSAGITSARLDAELILSDALEVNRSWLIAHNDNLVSENLAQTAVSRRVQREPLAYIRGWQEFYGRRFFVTPDVLIPRPESETLIDFTKQLDLKNARILDVGTGSGCLGITVALELPKASIQLIDISSAALEVAQRNINSLIDKHHPQITTLQSNLLQNTVDTPDAIIANLPYVDPSWERSPETAYEPSLALFADEDGLALIRQLIVQAAEKLSPNGYLLLEADVRQLDKIIQIAKGNSFRLLRREGYCLLLQKTSADTR